MKKSFPFFLSILKTYSLNIQLAKFWALRFIRRLFILIVSLEFDGPLLLKVQNWPIGHQRVGSRENDVIYSLAYISACKRNLLYMQNTGLKLWKPETPVLHINSAEYTRIAFLNLWVFDVIFSSTQLSQNFKVSNGGPINKKIPVKINRCLFKIRT